MLQSALLAVAQPMPRRELSCGLQILLLWGMLATPAQQRQEDRWRLAVLEGNCSKEAHQRIILLCVMDTRVEPMDT